ncbi:MAG: hypothetical protein KA314_22385 [Chloroflexi bacterium]|nr:hypothetical protein [Chloroflexota bacterium]MBP8058591.1 hypothetical protein [Chloroflexota bacterium]
MSLPQELSQETLTKIITRFGMTEVGAPYMSLTSPMSPAPVGALRLFGGNKVHKMVYISLTVPPIGLDSHMIFAFTPPESHIPHFTLDSVLAGPHFAFHLDLIPRADLGANLAYLNAIFDPLTPIFEAAKQIEGLTPAQLGPKQYALMSPWMLAYRANESAFTQIQTPVHGYLEHWFNLVENGIPAEAMPTGDFAQRDQLNRNAIFDPTVDKVWAQVARLVGEETSEKMRHILRNQAVE